ncbi:MAG: AAA family ATPase [Dehalococcoidia bacterium]
MSQVVIVSGPPGSGKSSVCESLCARYDRTVHLETDQLFGAIRMGFIKPWLPASDRQNRMVTRAAARAAAAYAQELYAVFIDAVAGPHLLPVYLEELAETGVAVHFALLVPSLEVTLRRGLEREPALRVPGPRLRALWQQFNGYGAFAGCTIDNSAMTPDQAADAVMSACGRGECLVLPQG